MMTGYPMSSASFRAISVVSTCNQQAILTTPRDPLLDLCSSFLGRMSPSNTYYPCSRATRV